MRYWNKRVGRIVVVVVVVDIPAFIDKRKNLPTLCKSAHKHQEIRSVADSASAVVVADGIGLVLEWLSLLCAQNVAD
jgi:hypothetical protein